MLQEITITNYPWSDHRTSPILINHQNQCSVASELSELSSQLAVSLVITAHLLVTETSDLVDKLLLDHKGRQVGSVAGQKYHGEEGPYGYDEFTGGPPGILYGHRVIEDKAPEEPYSLTDGKGGSMGICEEGQYTMNETTVCKICATIFNSKNIHIFMCI